MEKPEESGKVSRAENNMFLLTRTIWQYQQLIQDGEEQPIPSYQKEFRKDGKFILHNRGQIVDGPRLWKLSEDGSEIIINYGRTSSVGKIIELNTTKLRVKWGTLWCTFKTVSEETLVEIKMAERLETAV
jgi:hypothetical protein